MNEWKYGITFVTKIDLSGGLFKTRYERGTDLTLNNLINLVVL